MNGHPSEREQIHAEGCEIIRRLTDDLGLSQKEVADYAKCNASHLNQVLPDCPPRTISTDLLQRLRTALARRLLEVKRLLEQSRRFPYRLCSDRVWDAQTLLAREEFEACVACCEDGLKEENQPLLWFYRAQALERLGRDHQEVLRSYTELLKGDPNFHEGWYRYRHALGDEPLPIWYAESRHPDLFRRACDRMRSVGRGGLIALRAASGRGFYARVLDALRASLARGARVRCLLCDPGNKPALEDRSRQLTGDVTLHRRFSDRLQTSLKQLGEFAEQTRGSAGGLAIRTFGAPERITGAQTIILPNWGERGDLTDGILWQVPYQDIDREGRDCPCFEYPAAACDVSGKPETPFRHYLKDFFRAWGDPNEP